MERIQRALIMLEHMKKDANKGIEEHKKKLERIERHKKRLQNLCKHDFELESYYAGAVHKCKVCGTVEGG